MKTSKTSKQRSVLKIRTNLKAGKLPGGKLPRLKKAIVQCSAGHDCA